MNRFNDWQQGRARTSGSRLVPVREVSARGSTGRRGSRDQSRGTVARVLGAVATVEFVARGEEKEDNVTGFRDSDT